MPLVKDVKTLEGALKRFSEAYHQANASGG